MEDPLVSVAGLHALIYCERLFYLEEVERVRVADARVYAGRRLHVEEVAPSPEEEGERRRLELESEALGIRGAVDVLRRRDGALVPYEHKRGRAAGRRGAREAWESDRVQVGAYALLAEESYGQRIDEARVRYHADNVTVVVPVDALLRKQVCDAVARAVELRTTVDTGLPSRRRNVGVSGAPSRRSACQRRCGSRQTQSSARSDFCRPIRAGRPFMCSIMVRTWGAMQSG